MSGQCAGNPEENTRLGNAWFVPKTWTRKAKEWPALLTRLITSLLSPYEICDEFLPYLSFSYVQINLANSQPQSPPHLPPVSMFYALQLLWRDSWPFWSLKFIPIWCDSWSFGSLKFTLIWCDLLIFLVSENHTDLVWNPDSFGLWNPHWFGMTPDPFGLWNSHWLFNSG